MADAAVGAFVIDDGDRCALPMRLVVQDDLQREHGQRYAAHALHDGARNPAGATERLEAGSTGRPTLSFTTSV